MSANDKKKLDLGESDSESDCGNAPIKQVTKDRRRVGGKSLTINRKYAAHFEEKNRRADLFRAKEKGILAGESSSEEEDEDEIGEALTGKLDFDILKTISMIRNKDKRIYDKNFTPFNAEDEDNDQDEIETGRKTKPLRYKDQVRERIKKKMEEDSIDSDSDSDSNASARRLPDPHAGQSYVEGQASLKEAFKRAADSGDDDDEKAEEDGDVLFKVKEKSANELQKEEDDFQRYLSTLKSKSKTMSKVVERESSNMGMLESMFREPAQDEDEAFLRKFVLQEGWVNKVDGNGHGFGGDEDDDLSGDEEELERQEKFEQNYNFRFEEPGADTVATHARKDEQSVRRKESVRKRQRQEKREREHSERLKAEEELRRLRNLKQKELEARLEKVAKLAGVSHSRSYEKGHNKSVGLPGFSEKDLEGDFDPDEWDKKMAAAFDDDYYDGEDEELEQEMGGEEGDAPSAWKFLKMNNISVDSDEEEEEEGQDEEEQAGGGKQKKKTKAEKRVDKRKKKQEQDAAAATAAAESEAMEEYNRVREEGEEELNKMNYEDVIGGGIKTRFRYRKVAPNSYGLSTDEIWNADHRDLQAFVSLKHIVAPYKDTEFEANTKRRRRFRAALKETLIKKNLLQIKNKKKAERAQDEELEDDEGRDGTSNADDEHKLSHLERKNRKTEKALEASEEDDEGEEKKKSKSRKRKKKKTDTQVPDGDTAAKEDKEAASTKDEENAKKDDTSEPAKKKRKRKRKSKKSDEL